SPHLQPLPPIYVPPGLTDNPGPKGQGGHPGGTPATGASRTPAGYPVPGFASPQPGPRTIVPVPGPLMRPDPIAIPPQLRDIATAFGSPALKDLKDMQGRMQSPHGGLLNGGSQSQSDGDPCGKGDQTSTSSPGAGNQDDKQRLQPHTAPGDGKKS